MPPVERESLPPESFPANLQKAVAAGAPAPMKMMAARGMLPAPPDMLVRVLYQLGLDGDEAVRQAARGAIEEMPPEVLVGALSQEQPAPVLDWVAERRRGDGSIEQAVVLNRGVADETVAAIAARADATVVDLISNNEVRILRTSSILEAIYRNPAARMSTVDRLVELARREGIDLSRIPGLQEALDSGLDLKKSRDGGPGVDPEEYERLLQQEGAKAQAEDEQYSALDDDSLTRSEKERLLRELEGEDDEDEEIDEDEARKEPLYVQIQNMNISQKIRTATTGSREAINILIRDTNKLVHMAAIRSPRLNYHDIRKMARAKNLPDNVIGYIANNKDWTRHYEILVSLANNPKTPLDKTMAFLNHMRVNDLRDLSRNRNVPHQVARQAKNLMKKRTQR